MNFESVIKTIFDAIEDAAEEIVKLSEEAATFLNIVGPSAIPVAIDIAKQVENGKTDPAIAAQTFIDLGKLAASFKAADAAIKAQKDSSAAQDQATRA